MADFNYDDLPLGQAGTDTGTTRRIRLLQVLPGLNDFGLIECSLSVVELCDTHTALSYTWGPEQPLYTIIVNAKMLTIRQSLYQFLCVASKQHHSKPLWIDAICIDQKSIAERNDQVAFMSEIYSRAEHVLVWLGQGYEQTETVLRQIPLSSKAILLHNDPSLLPTGDRTYALVKAQHSNVYHPIVAGIRDLCNLAYWERCWIVQEFQLSGAKTLLYGNENVSAEALSELLGWYHRLQDVYPNIIDAPIPSAYALGTGQFRVGFQPRHANIRARLRNLADTIFRYRHCKCTDFHDHIYALRSVVEHGDRFPVDYATEEIELLVEVLVFCCEELFMNEPSSSSLNPNQRLLDYIRASSTLIRLLDFRSYTLHSIHRWLQKTGRESLQPSFYLTLPQRPRIVALDVTQLELTRASPVHRAQRLIEDYVRQHFEPVRCGKEDRKIILVSRDIINALDLNRKPISVYFLSSAALVLFSIADGKHSINGFIQLPKGGQQDIPGESIDYEPFPHGLWGVKLVTHAATQTGRSQSATSPALLFDDTRVGILAGVTLLGVPLWHSFRMGWSSTIRNSRPTNFRVASW